MKYTKEPWEYQEGRFNYLEHGYNQKGSIVAEGWLIATIEGEEILDYEANANRIVACVNGCEGFNPEAVKDMYEALEVAQTYIARKEMYSGVQDRTGLEVKIIKALALAKEVE